VSEAFLLRHEIDDFFMHSIVVVVIFIYLFLTNYVGQEFIDHNDYVFSTAYNVRWYVAPLHVQKLILFLLRRGSKSISLNFGSLFTLSLELFATLTKTALSYFTVVCSIQ
ncbi:PREDICTED: odorant receptor 49b-like, partial [Wasmannia auropunctata]|uniref:odorant receptor 49b-like n=1 Tax=Wasmannia auropunctata TaxID=64793 RepID=UPI0005EE6890